MGTLIMYVVMASSPVWFQSEQAACDKAQGTNAAIYMISTSGRLGADKDKKSILVLADGHNDLKAVTCPSAAGGHKIKNNSGITVDMSDKAKPAGPK